MAKSDRQAWEDSVAVYRRKQGLEPEDNTPKTEKSEPYRPKTFKEKIINFWYHYKAAVIIGVVLLAIVSYGTYDWLTQTKYDLTVLLTTKEGYIPQEEQDYLISRLSPYVADVTGNGEVEILIINIYGAGSDMTASQKLMATLSTGDIAMLLTDDAMYVDYFEGLGTNFVDLQTEFGVNTQTAENPYRYDLQNSALLGQVNKDDPLNNLSLMVRDFSSLKSGDSDVFSADEKEALQSFEITMNILSHYMAEEEAA